MSARSKTISIYGGFHNICTPINVRVKSDFDMNYYGLSGLIEFGVSKSVAAKIKKHMCGFKDCMCGIHHGWKWQYK